MSIAMPFNQSSKIKDIHKLKIDFFFFQNFQNLLQTMPVHPFFSSAGLSRTA